MLEKIYGPEEDKKKKKVKINSKGITKFIYIYHCRDKHSAGKI